MFVLYADKTQLTVREREPVTSGSINVYPVRFEFSPDWDGLDRTAVFQAGCRSWSVLLEDGGACIVPWEALAVSGCHLFAGVYGQKGADMVLPTIWADLGTVLEGAAPGQEAQPPTPELWQQELARKGDRLAYTETGELGLYAGEKVLSSVPTEGGGGTTDHRRLNHRDAAEQHPIASISGLRAELDRIPEPVEALTNSELEEMLK